MAGSSSIRSFRDLIVWQRGMMLVEECYRVTALLPARECYGLASQIRRAAASIPANIAEGHGSVHRRQYLRYVMIAQGSLRELETHLEIAVRVRLLEGDQTAQAMRLCTETGRMLRSLYSALNRGTEVRPRQTQPGSRMRDVNHAKAAPSEPAAGLGRGGGQPSP